MLSKISLNNPWYFLPVCLLISFSVAYWLYAGLKKKHDVSRAVHVSLFGLRFLCVLLISVFLLDIFLKYVTNETENPVIILAVDNSSSMVSGSDSSFIKGAFVEKIKTLEKNTGKKYRMQRVLFGSASQAQGNLDFKEKETDIGRLLNDIENNYANQNIGALIIASDGIYNKGSNPIYNAEHVNYPIYTIAAGDTTENKDILIQKIDHNQVAYLGNNFPVEVVVQAKKLSGKNAVLSLWQDGILRDKRIISIGSDNFLSASQFTLSAEKTGIVRYEARITVLEGEKNISNNAQPFVVEVIDNKEKVLLLANVPHPDISAIKSAITDHSNYELDYELLGNFKGNVKPYALVIIHGLAANQTILNDCKTNAVPFWVVNPQTTDGLPGVKINSSFNRYNETESYLNKSFGLFGLSPQLEKFVKDLPALRSFFGNYVPLNSSNILISQRIGEVETENPVLLFTEMNGLKCGTFIGEGLWRWKMRDFTEHKNDELFTELITKCVQYLAVKNDKSRFRLSSKKILSENEALEMQAEVYNKSYEPVTEPDVNLVLSNSDNKKFNYTFSKTSKAYNLNVGLLPAGDYQYEASVKYNNELLVKKGIISVKEVLAEKINTVANHHVLYQLSALSKGKLFYPAQINKLEDELLKNEEIKAVTYSQNSTSPLIDLKWLFYVALLLFVAEWALRKRFLHI